MAFAAMCGGAVLTGTRRLRFKESDRGAVMAEELAKFGVSVEIGENEIRVGGEAPRALRPGDVVNIPPEVKHWHGAAADSEFTHIAVEVPGENTSTEWCEPVDDSTYGALCVGDASARL